VSATLNERAAARDMPDSEKILQEVKNSGVNKAMRDYVPPKGTTMIRTKEDARRVVKILK